jgi:hypothetical protein
MTVFEPDVSPWAEWRPEQIAWLAELDGVAA